MGMLAPFHGCFRASSPRQYLRVRAPHVAPTSELKCSPPPIGVFGLDPIASMTSQPLSEEAWSVLDGTEPWGEHLHTFCQDLALAGNRDIYVDIGK